MTIAQSASPTMPSSAVARMFEGFSLEITAKDLPGLSAAAALIPAATKMTITALPNEELASSVVAARELRQLGFLAAPHISARRLQSVAELEVSLAALQAAGADRAFIVAGDLPRALGPFDDALAVIRSGLLARYGIRTVGIAGYPEGHPGIAAEHLWRAMADKAQELDRQGHSVAIVTQFGFDAAAMLDWVGSVRDRGIDAPVRLGVPGPTSVRRLMAFAAHCGVGASTRVLRKYGISLTRLMGAAGPDRLVDDLVAGYDPARHGVVRLHFFPFGGLRPCAEWVRAYRLSTT